MKKMLKRMAIAATLAGGFLGASMSAQAATSVSWTSPANNSVAPVGTAVKPMGVANASGQTSTAVDLVLVLDSSGSMGSTATVGAVTQSRQAWQAEIATALVNSLPLSPTMRVSVVEFDSDANTVQTLSPLSSDLAAVIAAINGVDASGGTDIRDGINQGFAELSANGSLLDPSVLSAMVVFSDGGSSSTDTNVAAAAAEAGGVDLLAAVALPGASLPAMEAVVDGADDILGNADDTGPLIDGTQDLQAVIDALGGGGTLVGIDHVDVTMPDGTVFADVAVDAFGNFMAPVPFNIAAGPNTWTALAVGTDGSSSSATVTVIGTDDTVVPVPAPLLLIVTGLLLLARRRR